VRYGFVARHQIDLAREDDVPDAAGVAWGVLRVARKRTEQSRMPG